MPQGTKSVSGQVFDTIPEGRDRLSRQDDTIAAWSLGRGGSIHFVPDDGDEAGQGITSFRMEGLNLRRSSDISKSLGTLISIDGASIVTLYNGPAIMNKALTLGSSGLFSSSQQNWIVRGILLASSNCCFLDYIVVYNSVLNS
ncbi:hypothetical protein ACS0TY_011246 [Phlomoides rotata]